jgi:hypothetical protein
MAIISVSVELTALEGASVQKGQDGTDFVCIPVKQADLYLTDAGKAYLCLSVMDKRGGVDQYGKTHSVVQHHSKEVREALDRAGQRAPFIGSGKLVATTQSQPQQQYQGQQPYAQPYAQQQYVQPQQMPANAQPYQPTAGAQQQAVNDLPF